MKSTYSGTRLVTPSSYATCIVVVYYQVHDIQDGLITVMLLPVKRNPFADKRQFSSVLLLVEAEFFIDTCHRLQE